MHKIQNYAISKRLFNSSGIVYSRQCAAEWVTGSVYILPLQPVNRNTHYQKCYCQICEEINPNYLGFELCKFFKIYSLHN